MDFWNFLKFDKFIHAFVFAVLVVLLIVGFKKQYSFKQIRFNAILSAITFSVFYGLLIEILQGTMFYERSASLPDAIANTIGCVLGVIAFYAIYGSEHSREVS